MRTLSLRASFTALILLCLSACDGTEGPASSSVGLDNLSCPAGKVPWDFSKFDNGTTSESLAQLGGEVLDAGLIRNFIRVKSARCVSNSNPVDLTGPMRSVLDFRQTGLVRSYHSNVFFENHGCLTGDATVEYTCSETPDVLRTSNVFANILCAEPAAERQVSCVPENCYGRTRRDRNLECAPDLIKPVESLDGLKVVFDLIARPLQDPARASETAYGRSSAGADVLGFDNHLVYRFRGSVEVPGAVAPRQEITLWMKSRFPAISSGGTTLSAEFDGFRCVIGRIDLSKFTPSSSGGVQRVAFDELLRIPDTCQDGRPFQQAHLAALLANNLLDAATWTLPTQAVSTQLMVSYDLEGNSIATPKDTPVESTCNIKPVDFFFNHQSRVHNMAEYYSQNALPVGHSVLAANSPSPNVLFTTGANLIAATEVNVRGLEFTVNKAGAARGIIPVDLTMALSGPEAELWAQWLASKRLEVNGYIYGLQEKKWLGLDNYVAGAEESSTGIFPVPDTAIKDAQGRVAVDASAMIPLPPQGLKAVFNDGVSEGGGTAVLNLPISNAVRTALFNPTSKYPLVSGGTRNYILQVCPSGKAYAKYSVYDGGNLAQKTVEAAPKSTLQPGQSSRLVTARNGCARSAVFSIRGENITTPIPEVELGDGDLSELNPTTSGESRMATTFDSDTTRECEGTRCETTVSQGLGGKSAPSDDKVIFIVNEEAQEDTTDRFQTSFNLLGFNVLEAVQSGTLGPVKTELTISPDYEAIADAFGKPYPAFEIEGENITIGVNGLSVGFEYKVPLRFGPLQGDLVFGVGVGAGVGVELSHEYNPNVENSCAVVQPDGGFTTEGGSCPNQNVAMPALPFLTARDLCYFMGGELVEPRTDAEATAMRSAIPATEEVWVGGQVGNEYRDNTTCAESWSSSVCASNHKTYLRWLSDATTFRRSDSFGAFSSVGEPATLGGQTIDAQQLTAQKPVNSAVTLSGNTFKVKPMTDAYRSVCTRPVVTSGKAHKVSIGIVAAFSAGFSVGFCVPSADVGICLEGSINLLEAKLVPAMAYSHTTLTDNTGRSAVGSKMIFDVTWSVNLLSGAIEVKLVTPFFSIGYTLVSYDGFKVGEGTLAEWERVFRKDFQ